MLKQQAEDCDPDGEPYRPSSVDIVLDNPEVALRQLGNADPVVKWAPSASDLFGLNQGFYLDFPGSALSPGCIYETDFWKYTGDRPAAVYAHIVQDPSRRDRLYLQYWFYWYFNDWNNKHESDWEGITLQFEAASIEEALAGQPVAVGYSQHEGGERALWNDTKLTRDGDHPVVYSSAGSHASYYGSAVYLGRGASEGFGCDTTTGPSDRVVPEVVVLPDRVDDPNDPLAWLSFNGRWGERQSGPFNGPTGPAAKDRWLDPAPWFEDLRDDSVVIPGGESAGQVGRQRLLRRRRARLAGADQLQDVARPGRADAAARRCCWWRSSCGARSGTRSSHARSGAGGGWARSSAPPWRRTSGSRSSSCSSASCTSRRRCSPG